MNIARASFMHQTTYFVLNMACEPTILATLWNNPIGIKQKELQYLKW